MVSGLLQCCIGHPDTFQSDVDKHSSNICQVKPGYDDLGMPGWVEVFDLGETIFSTDLEYDPLAS